MGFLKKSRKPVLACLSIVLLMGTTPLAQAKFKKDTWKKDTHCDSANLNTICSNLLETSSYDAQCMDLCAAAENTEADCVSKCAESLQTTEAQSQILAQCLAIEYNARSMGQFITISTLSLAAAGVCIPQCFNPATKQSIRDACRWGGAAVGLVDMGYSLILKSMYSQKIAVMQDIIWPAGGAALGVVLGMGNGSGKKDGKKNVETSGPDPAPADGAPAPADGAAASDSSTTSSSGSSTSGSSAPAPTQPERSRMDAVMDCIPFLSSTARAASSGFQIFGVKDRVAEACTSLETLLSENGTIAPGAPGADIQLGIQLGDLSASNQAASEEYTDGTGSTANAAGGDAMGSFDNIAKTAEAMASKNSGGFKKGDLKNFYDGAKKLGIDFPGVAKTIQSSGAASALNGLLDRSPLSTEEKSAAKKMAENSAKFAEKHMASFYAGAGASKKSASKDGKEKDPYAALFGGAPSGGLGAVGGTQNFEGASTATAGRMAPASEDEIFHPGYPGSIFDIITEKSRLVLPRVEELEWDYVLNRAFHQLPKKDPNAPAVKVKR
jgi:hypothetical protein